MARSVYILMPKGKVPLEDYLLDLGDNIARQYGYRGNLTVDSTDRLHDPVTLAAELWKHPDSFLAVGAEDGQFCYLIPVADNRQLIQQLRCSEMQDAWSILHGMMAG